MQAQRIRPVWKAGCKNARERGLRVAAGMNFEYLAIRLMQPGDDDDLITGCDPAQRRRESRVHFEPRIRRSLGALSWSIIATSERRADAPDRMKRISCARLDHLSSERTFSSVPKYRCQP